ncbi:hypothetical protein [Streptomyces sp. enrichment culture]|uniref:hypothetical protein n=1 Tax=Streptomyces sp. enrichment culture TaxID=1795815 RepID=UPI003F574193
MRTGQGGAPFADPRNAAADTLRAKDRAYTVEMRFAYGLLPLPGTGEALTTELTEAVHSSLIDRAAGRGVITPVGTRVAGPLRPPRKGRRRGRRGRGPVGRMKAVVTGAMTGPLAASPAAG